MTTTLAYLVVIVAGILTAILFRHRTLKAPPTIVLFVAVICIGATVLRLQRDESERVQRDAAKSDYQACLTRVDRSTGNREMWLYVISLLANNRSQVAADLQAQLDKNLPALTLADCETP